HGLEVRGRQGRDAFQCNRRQGPVGGLRRWGVDGWRCLRAERRRGEPEDRVLGRREAADSARQGIQSDVSYHVRSRCAADAAWVSSRSIALGVLLVALYT